MAQLKLINGLPVTQTEYDESIYYSSGLAADTNITLPNGQTFATSAKDLIVILNGLEKEVTRDFTVVSSTQIKFVYALPNDSIVRFKMNI